MSRRIIFGCKVADVLNTSRVIGSAAEDDNDAGKAPLVRCPLGRTSAARLSASAKPCALPLKAPRQNISNVSNFAQTDGAGSVFNQSSLAEERRQAGWLPGPELPQPADPGSPCDFLSTVTSPIL